LKERLTWAKLLAVVFCLAGCVLVADAASPAAWGSNLTGILTGVLSGLCYAAYSLMGRKGSNRGLSPWTTLLYTFAFAAVILLAVNLLPGNLLPGSAAKPPDLFWLGNAWWGWGVLFLLAAVPTIAGFGLYNVSLSLLPSSVVNLVVTLEPVFTSVTAYFLLGERQTTLQISGAVLIMGGVIFLRLFHREADSEQPAGT
jgi:drug/metabolite transporter (DMT)-like permease